MIEQQAVAVLTSTIENDVRGEDGEVLWTPVWCAVSVLRSIRRGATVAS